jgi:hypothetical protein
MMFGFQYSADFYSWLIFCLIPSLIFLFALLKYERARNWTKDAIENNDKKAHQSDLTFLLVSVTGWLCANGTLVAVGLNLFEGKETLAVALETFGFTAVCFGLNKYFNRPRTEDDIPKPPEDKETLTSKIT